MRTTFLHVLKPTCKKLSIRYYCCINNLNLLDFLQTFIMATAVSSDETLDSLLFKATNPSNKLEDVNTIKQFCDAVNSNMGGDAPAWACKNLAHKIQSPQEREALQALAVLEACVKSCGTVFHSEVGKFKFLNELIKLVSPKYLVNLKTIQKYGKLF